MGGLVLVGTIVEAYVQSLGFYHEHYLWPKKKYGVLTPLRWQDVVFLFAFWLVAMGLVYLSCRLLKNALRRDLSVMP